MGCDNKPKRSNGSCWGLLFCVIYVLAFVFIPSDDEYMPKVQREVVYVGYGKTVAPESISEDGETYMVRPRKEGEPQTYRFVSKDGGKVIYFEGTDKKCSCTCFAAGVGM